MTTTTAWGTARAPTDLHRAIDQATILKIEVQQLRNLLRSGATIDPHRLLTMDHAVDVLAAALIACRDQTSSLP